MSIFLAYYADSETQEITAAILNAAADENIKIPDNAVGKMNNDIIVHLSIKNCQRSEVWTGMTRREFYLAQSTGQQCFYPYKPATEDEIETATDIQFDQDIAYR